MDDSPPPRTHTATRAPINASQAAIKHETIDIDDTPPAKRMKVEFEEGADREAKPGEAIKDEGDDDL